MHARVTTLVLQRDKVDEALHILHNRIAEIKQQKGFHDILALVDRASGKCTIITLWANEADLRASEASGYVQARLAEMAPLTTVLPTREVFEVAVDDLSGLGVGTKAARTTTALVQPGKTDEAIRLIRDSVAPAARQQKGYNGLLHLVDRATGKGISCTFWESEVDLTANEAGGYYQAQIAKVLPLMAGQPTREAYELTLPALMPAPVAQAQAQPHAPAP